MTKKYIVECRSCRTKISFTKAEVQSNPGSEKEGPWLFFNCPVCRTFNTTDE